MRKRKCDHITPVLKELHWLPVRQRIKYKICMLTFKGLHGLAPKYVSDMLTRYAPGRRLRSSAETLLHVKVPRLKNTGGRAFEVAAPKLWNRLPSSLRNCLDFDDFKRDLKTHFYREAFDE